MDHCILLLQHLSTHMHLITNGYRTPFKDQLDRSKATCSFKFASQKLHCSLQSKFFMLTVVVVIVSSAFHVQSEAVNTENIFLLYVFFQVLSFHFKSTSFQTAIPARQTMKLNSPQGLTPKIVVIFPGPLMSSFGTGFFSS